MCEQSALAVRDASFCCTDTTASVENLAVGSNQASLYGDGANERNFELKGRLGDAFVEHRPNGEIDAAIEKCRRVRGY